jgi:hypothetical protein
VIRTETLLIRVSPRLQADVDEDEATSDAEDETDRKIDDEAEPEADVDEDVLGIQAEFIQRFEEDDEQVHALSSPRVEVYSEQHENEVESPFEEDEPEVEPEAKASVVQVEEVAPEEVAREEVDDDDDDDLFGDRELQEEAAAVDNGDVSPELDGADNDSLFGSNEVDEEPVYYFLGNGDHSYLQNLAQAQHHPAVFPGYDDWDDDL